MAQTEMAYCPECDGNIKLSYPRIGQRIVCPFCGTELEVISLSPIELDWYLEDDDEEEKYYEDDEEW